MPKVNGILETALYVENVQRSAHFYRKLFGFETLLESDRLIALEVASRNVLLLFLRGATREAFTTSGGTIPGHGNAGGGHLAFSVTADEVDAWRNRLAAEGIAIEGEVNWTGGSTSIYFRDLDGHLVELMSPGFWSIY